MDVDVGRGVVFGGGKARDRRGGGDGETRRAVQDPAQVLTLLGPPSICCPPIELVAVMAATVPNTRSEGTRYGRRAIPGDGDAPDVLTGSGIVFTVMSVLQGILDDGFLPVKPVFSRYRARSCRACQSRRPRTRAPSPGWRMLPAGPPEARPRAPRLSFSRRSGGGGRSALPPGGRATAPHRGWYGEARTGPARSPRASSDRLRAAGRSSRREHASRARTTGNSRAPGVPTGRRAGDRRLRWRRRPGRV